MIFPLLSGFTWLHRTPLVWCMILLNVGFFAWTYPTYQLAEGLATDLISKVAYQKSTGRIMAGLVSDPDAASLILKRKTTWSPGYEKVSRRAVQGDEKAILALAGFAFREPDFLNAVVDHLKASAMNPELENTNLRRLASVSSPARALRVDWVEVEDWIEDTEQLLAVQSIHPSYRFGLLAGKEQVFRWITYQISHSGWSHLFWNMLFLAVFGTFVELMRGRMAFLVTVWASGFAAAVAYSLFSGLSASPLVGASGAVSGLIASIVVLGHRRIPFAYWVLPSKGYYGLKMGPAWLLFPAFILPDLSGYLAQPQLSGVAYAAHLGGAVAGALVAHFYPISDSNWREFYSSPLVRLTRKYKAHA